MRRLVASWWPYFAWWLVWGLCTPLWADDAAGTHDATSARFLPPRDSSALTETHAPQGIRPPQTEIDQGVPGVPGTVRQPGQTVDWKLSLTDARRIALSNNKDIAYVRYMPMEAEARVEAENAAFDMVFELGGTWNKSDRQVASEIQSQGSTLEAVVNEKFGPGPRLPDTIALSKPLHTGGTFRVSQGAVYDRFSPAGDFLLVNPSWFSSTNFTLEQPLFRGRGLKINRVGIRIAQANRRQSIQTFRATVQAQLRDVELAYWQLHYAHRDLATRQEAVAYARTMWENEKQRLALGTSWKGDVAQAREQYEVFRIDANAAENQVLAAENQFRRVLGISGWDGRQVVVVDEATETEAHVDWPSAVASAMQNRPELRAQQEAVQAAKLELYRARNGLLPDVALVGNYSITGLDDDYDQSLNRLTEGRYSDWTLGFVYRQPIGRRPASAAVRRSQATLRRQGALLQKLEHEIQHELQGAYQDLAASWRTLALHGSRLAAATVQLKALTDRRREGDPQRRVSLDLLLRTYVSYTVAQLEEAWAVTRYNQTITQWEYAKGTILDHSSVVVAEEIPTPEPRGLHEDTAARAEGEVSGS